MQTDKFKIRSLSTCLEDVLEWIEIGMVNGVHYDKQSIIDSIKAVLRETK